MVTEEKIWEYIDGGLTESERQDIRFAIANDGAVAALYQEALSLHTALGDISAEQPSMAFTENVMRAVAPQFQHAVAPRVSIIPLLVSAVPFVIAIVLASIALVISKVDFAHLYHIDTGIFNSQFMNTMKILFIMVDSVLLILFLEQWMLSRKKHQL